MPTNEERRRRRAVQRQENRAAQMIGGAVTPASGALWGSKGDAVSDLEMVECKRTDKKQITLKKEWLDKLFAEAIARGKVPYLHIEISGHSYWLLSEPDGEELIERARYGPDG